ncbi:MAG: cation diffusion facilitator family transporter [Peptoniphilaceae bacterium]|nr:cation diffusion facilitator family transporter [Peptoniphilaceae bacterium]MDD7383376.1 cation diffusion facilitator family transporter [Peptoniphilaceae bacterium]MDY3738253.1 cation diffusion facilitator family transporter [Peptoniphilaceae bacterium]
MFNFIASHFVKNYKDYEDPDVRKNLISMSGIFTMAINILLFLIKIIIGVFSNSVSVISDAFNNLSDVMSNLIAIIGSILSGRPADYEHPFGHGRYETISSFIISLIIMFLGFEMIKTSILNMIKGEISEISNIAILILIFSLLFKIYIYRLNEKLYNKLKSTINEAVAIDARNDLFATISIIFAIIMQKFINFNFDALMGILVSFIVFKGGVELFLETLNTLLGKRVDDSVIEEISEIILKGDYVKGFHDLQIHSYGHGVMIGSVDVEIAGDITVEIGHRSVNNIEKEIKNKTGVKLTIHMDPTYNINKVEKTF